MKLIKTVKIILPTFNEEKSIIPLETELAKLKSSLENRFKVSLVWVNDGSSDSSESMIKKILKKEDVLINFLKNYGKTSAISAGIELSELSDYVAILDTDLQDDPKFIKDMLQKLQKEKLDLIIGNRTNRYTKNFLKNASSKLIKLIINSLFKNLKINDINCGMKIMTNQVTQSLYLKSDYHRYIPLIAHVNGFSVGEIEILQRERKYGTSKYGVTGLIRTWRSFSDLLNIIFISKFATNPFSFFGKVGLFLLFIGLIILFYLTMLWINGKPIDSRPLFFLGTLLVTTSINLLSIGLIGDLIKMDKKQNKTYTLKKEK